jgi:D-xylose transport system substrate-binding protein
MQKRVKGGVVLLAALSLLAAACGSDDDDGGSSATTAAGSETTAGEGGGGESAGGKVGFILPDSASSARWESFDRPLIEAECAAAGLECLIQNAEGDADNMATIADQMIADGIGVLAIVNLDSDSGAAIQEKARAAGVKNIDYDRLTLGGFADVYVSFDNVAVGTAQGEGIIECMGGAGNVEGKRIIQLHGSPTDNNATLFKQGYQAAIEGSGIETVGEEAVPDWDNAQGGVIFEQLLTAAGGEIDGVLVANDGLSLAAQAVLADAGLTVPTTGQDATVEGLRAILQGTQCMTVYKPVVEEAKGAVAAAAQLLAGEEVTANATIDNGNGEIPYVQAAVQSIFIDDVKTVIEDGFVTAEAVCEGIEDLCAENGIEAGAGGGDSGESAGGKVGFILPDSASSARWESFDRPLIEAACEAAGIECLIQNAEGDADNMATIADQMIADGIGVLAIVNLDSDSGAAIQEKAAAAGVKNIDYDRLTLGGFADVYVSFDNVAVGTAQGEGIIECMGGAGNVEGKRIIQLHGSPTDNNATLFREGYQAAIEGSGIETVGEEAVPEWDNAQGGVIFEQLLTAAGGEIDGVLVANDGLSLAAQAVLADAGLTVPTTGQDATVEGLRAILQGTQCMTVYKPVVEEANGAVAAAVALLAGEEVDANATIDNGNGEIPYVQAAVQSIFIDQVKDVVADGFVDAAELCEGIEDLCAENGIEV